MMEHQGFHRGFLCHGNYPVFAAKDARVGSVYKGELSVYAPGLFAPLKPTTEEDL